MRNKVAYGAGCRSTPGHAATNVAIVTPSSNAAVMFHVACTCSLFAVAGQPGQESVTLILGASSNVCECDCILVYMMANSLRNGEVLLQLLRCRQLFGAVEQSRQLYCCIELW
eukprot:1271827-Amphidinium_carterae.1